ncbi:MAG: DUF1496 domain-containing protein [Bradyrhizobium sp.]|uniref:DUF1496 domain-containing protein n=1 Tax=Bradyrhizobium sp. TaxID=376 RepID=UPI0027314963|nr:DUF1496 domain-containing protein [Bradyrhizobium sp.]MDP1865199.1 DUF1496 domain-containing protein [Bradyrhizobium sp.]
MNGALVSQKVPPRRQAIPVGCFLNNLEDVMKVSSHFGGCSIAATLCLASPSLLYAQVADVCVYESKQYSEGASICLRPTLMLSCRLEGTRMVWTIVTDQDTSRLCLPPSVSRHHRKPATKVSKVASPYSRPAAGAAKCFQFNGRTYCE